MFLQVVHSLNVWMRFYGTFVLQQLKIADVILPARKLRWLRTLFIQIEKYIV